MRPFLAEQFGTEMLFLIGGSTTLVLAAGGGSQAVLGVCGSVAGLVVVLASLGGWRGRRSALSGRSA
ncbi:MAG: hypothetical protein MUE52_08855 [Tabrizicola sp.]|nr:hypothetical protein [Tabrizicola sp.]